MDDVPELDDTSFVDKTLHWDCRVPVVKVTVFRHDRRTSVMKASEKRSVGGEPPPQPPVLPDPRGFLVVVGGVVVGSVVVVGGGVLLGP